MCNILYVVYEKLIIEDAAHRPAHGNTTLHKALILVNFLNIYFYESSYC
ncbi:hypothetical protein [Anabaena sp. YBS01]|nr:hypothetical protein [Anabaena sp. YBS01]